ncbi:response regulator [Rhizobium helianthi]|uniref:Response regulator n=1 Tax=Rhizobium helianthi TaxID=1132695 RepID=A0ABW4M363_9HYPH
MVFKAESAGKILIVDDDPGVRQALKACFQDEGYEAFAAADGVQMRALMLTNVFDIILLDLTFPGKDDGIDLAREIRSRSNIPIIIVSARSQLMDRVLGLEIGADDYITKPFHLREIHSRVRAVLKRTRPQHVFNEEHVYHFDNLTLDTFTRRVIMDEKDEVALTTGEFDMLLTLLTHPNRVLSRDFLMGETRARHLGNMDRSIDAQIARLRRKIEPDPHRPRIIISVRGVGYSLAVPVSKAPRASS